jgi:hypothetical protein
MQIITFVTGNPARAYSDRQAFEAAIAERVPGYRAADSQTAR